MQWRASSDFPPSTSWRINLGYMIEVKCLSALNTGEMKKKFDRENLITASQITQPVQLNYKTYIICDVVHICLLVINITDSNAKFYGLLFIRVFWVHDVWKKPAHALHLRQHHHFGRRTHHFICRTKSWTTDLKTSIKTSKTRKTIESRDPRTMHCYILRDILRI